MQAEHFNGSHTYGLVTMLEHRTDAGSHLANWFSNSFGDLSGEPNTARQGTTIARAAVLSNDADIYMPVQNEARIRFADSAGVHIALGITDEAMPPERRIPAGLIALSNGTQATAYIDRHYVLGPEGAHVSISGISGLATKTSYAMFLLQALFQTMKDENEVAAILLNVKHGDLLQIDQEGSLSDEDKERWKAIGLEPRPFEKVRYLLPAGKDYFTTFRPNSFTLPLSYDTYAYALTDTADKLDLLFSNIISPTRRTPLTASSEKSPTASPTTKPAGRRSRIGTRCSTDHRCSTQRTAGRSRSATSVPSPSLASVASCAAWCRRAHWGGSLGNAQRIWSTSAKRLKRFGAGQWSAWTSPA